MSFIKNKESKTWIKIVTALFILKIVARQSAYGNQIAEEIKRITQQTLQPNPNFLYPLLRTMEEEGYLEGKWENPTTRSKRIYIITPSGRNYVQILQEKVYAKFLEIERRQQAIRKFLFEE
ncbi:DNA-binding PadR family transcriptional regulator [Sporomusaceae bacterium BoRhaA]|jgi:PadR family transcriptional regulator, regulatory protein PadR|uniref:PadR family transcriptional regulator n=1 Tax=Pelorhabdus rhamnosifermentans TaxID=2772457 RepID=UPI001C0627E0|nr:PadR family transcriptional regulator [Pelorhabdus rhamnosifermentans]MBU2699853.1 DNA-binding PadR family transcriptional regulator [Pelorhabdus rhamnosifermentans]